MQQVEGKGELRLNDHEITPFDNIINSFFASYDGFVLIFNTITNTTQIACK